MAWTPPPSMTAGTLVTETYWNTNVQANLLYLYSQITAPPYCSLKGTTAQTLTTGTTYYSLLFDTEIDDASNMHVSGNTAAIVVPSAGVYMVNGGWSASVTTGNVIRIAYAVNGTSADDTYVQIPSTGGFFGVTLSRYVRLAAGDSVTLQALSTQAGLPVAVSAQARPYFQVRWVGL
jgi:hypothetical protein